MKPLYPFLLSLIIFLSCSKTIYTDQYHRIKTYQLGDRGIGNGKRVIYEESGSNRGEWYNDIFFVIKNGETYRCVKRFSFQAVTDSMLYFKGRLVEIYDFFPDGREAIKGTILVDSVIESGKDKGLYRKVLYNGYPYSYLVCTKETYVKDTVFRWRGRPVKTLLWNVVAGVEFISSADNTVLHRDSAFYSSYYGKGLGLIKSISHHKDDQGVITTGETLLKNIENIDQ